MFDLRKAPRKRNLNSPLVLASNKKSILIYSFYMMIYDNVMGDDNDDVPGVRSLSHVNLFRSLFERPL